MTKVSWREMIKIGWSGDYKEGELQELPEQAYVEFTLEGGNVIVCHVKNGHLYIRVRAFHGRLVVKPETSSAISVTAEGE